MVNPSAAIIRPQPQMVLHNNAIPLKVLNGVLFSIVHPKMIIEIMHKFVLAEYL